MYSRELLRSSIQSHKPHALLSFQRQPRLGKPGGPPPPPSSGVHAVRLHDSERRALTEHTLILPSPWYVMHGLRTVYFGVEY